jgi:hypothetical protein
MRVRSSSDEEWGKIPALVPPGWLRPSAAKRDRPRKTDQWAATPKRDSLW